MKRRTSQPAQRKTMPSWVCRRQKTAVVSSSSFSLFLLLRLLSEPPLAPLSRRPTEHRDRCAPPPSLPIPALYLGSGGSTYSSPLVRRLCVAPSLFSAGPSRVHTLGGRALHESQGGPPAHWCPSPRVYTSPVRRGHARSPRRRGWPSLRRANAGRSAPQSASTPFAAASPSS